jgi:DNA mismatch repair protein MutS2
LLTQGKRQLQDEVHTARRKVAEQIELLKRTPSMKQAVAVSESLKTMEADLQQDRELPSQTTASEVLAADFKHQPEAGDRVFLPSLGQTGEVTSIDRKAGMITVRLGSLQTRVPFEQARPVAAMLPKKRQVPPPLTLPQHLPQDSIEVRTSSNTLDLRGLRVDEALEAVDRFLDKLFAAGSAAAFLVHGHGTGALKSALRDYLRKSPYLRHFRCGTLEEGGDGVTIARLK